MSEPDRVRIGLAPGERHELQLPGLGTAGFRWEVEVSGAADAVAVSTGRTPPGPDQRVGRSTTEVLTIEALRPGTATVVARHRRAWESAPPRAERVLVIEVGPGPAGAADDLTDPPEQPPHGG